LQNCAVLFPNLEVLTISLDSEYETWWQPENYAAFASLPRTIIALVLMLDTMRLPPMPSSAFVRLIKTHAPHCGVHVTTPPKYIDRRDANLTLNLDDDGLLPKPPWCQCPDCGETYSPEVLRRSTFQAW
jgi:hypothetical protein